MSEVLTKEQINNTFAEILKQTDRASALVSCALLDELLERLLLAFFMEHGNTKRDLFDGMTPLSTMSTKINIAYHMGLIEQYIFEDLGLIRKIRNDFAHSFETINFETQRIKDRCFQLKMLTNTKPPKEAMDSIKCTKNFFQINTTLLAAELQFRISQIERLEPFQYRKEEGTGKEDKGFQKNLIISLREKEAKLENKKG